MATPEQPVPWGCVIGRFQPFHNDHLSLVSEAFQSRGRVIIGITNPDKTQQLSVPEAPHRHLSAANPFTFWQRLELVSAALAGVVAPDCLRIVPFPIHDVGLWSSYLPDRTECWVRERGRWEARKTQNLRARYQVQTRPPVVEEVSGTQIRALMATGDRSWHAFVPPAVSNLIERWLAEGTLSMSISGAPSNRPGPTTP